MAVAEIIAVSASCLMLINEIRNLSRNKIIERFIFESHVLIDRLDTIEKTLIRLINK